ncbi:MAG TPA: hypothetical protein VI248_05285 [Kineosporiaceae bacterium]
MLAGLPLDEAVPGLDRARAVARPAPVAVPSGGHGVKVLGRAQIGRHAVGLAVPDARQHVHLIGKTGAGKSTLPLNMILADVHAHRGAVVIDPRGDLILDILDRLPVDTAGRVHIIDPDQPHPASFNPLDPGPGPGSGQGAGAGVSDAHLAVDKPGRDLRADLPTALGPGPRCGRVTERTPGVARYGRPRRWVPMPMRQIDSHP